MSSKFLRRIISISMALVMVFVFASCSDEKQGENDTQPDVQNETTVQTGAGVDVTLNNSSVNSVTETTTVPEETTIFSSAVQQTVDILLSKNFYFTGTIQMNNGETIDTTMSCEGDNYRFDMNASQMNMGMCYIDGNPYIINNSKKQYVLFDETAINSLDKVLSSLSSLGVSVSGADMSQLKGMMSDFDQNMDFSQYISEGEFFEYTQEINGETYICSKFETEYGSIIIYTLDGTLKYLDIYDADGLRQMRMNVTVFMPVVLTPVSLNGLTQAASILNLFGLG